jgi:small nuclear ribonucleoprotein (snRNP)-like protein
MSDKEYLEEIGFVVKLGEYIEVWVEGGRKIEGKLVRYDAKFKNMVIRTNDNKEVFIPRRYVVAILKNKVQPSS